MSSKASRIRDLYAQGLGTGEIAKIVGCKPEYVRVAGRQRKDDYLSSADRTYRINRYGSMSAYYAAHNAERAPNRKAYYAKRWKTDPEYRAKKQAKFAILQQQRASARESL